MKSFRSLLIFLMLLSAVAAVAQTGTQNKRDSNRNGHRRYQSRSGNVSYGTTSNLQLQQGQRIDINAAPGRQALLDAIAAAEAKREHRDTGSSSGGSGSSGHDRDHDKDHDRDHDRDGNHRDHDSHRTELLYGGIRIDYRQYDRGWRDDNFCYPHYIFDPYSVDRCIASPWYYYSFLPAYVDNSRIVIAPAYGDPLFGGMSYPYEPTYYYRDEDRDSVYTNNWSRRRPLDTAIDKIIVAFERQDRRAVSDLCPTNGAILLGVDNALFYGVKADDFYDMMMDATMNTHTIDYRVDAVSINDDEAEVIAHHDFFDSWGERCTVFHRYHLFAERNNIVIRYFETARAMYW